MDAVLKEMMLVESVLVEAGGKESYGYKKRVSLIYRTATTTYPCCLPALGEFCRSWSYMTYPTAKVSNFPLKTSLYALIL